MLVMFYKVAVNTELTNTELLLSEKYRVRSLQASDYVFVNQ